MRVQNLINLLDRPIAYHRCFAEIGGSVTAGVFLSQAVYWSQRTQDEDGWFWKTQKEWFEETYLKRREQEAARRELRAAGILEEKKKGTPAKLYFRVKAETLANRLLSPGCQDVTNLDAVMPHAASKHAQNDQSRPTSADRPRMADSYNLLNTETTPETTPENLKPLSPLGSLPPPNKQEREGVANASESQEAIAHPPDEPEQNPTLGNKFSSVKSQSSAPPRGPVENAQVHYSHLPPYRVSWKAGEYQPLYLADILKRLRSQWPDRTSSDAVARLENAEREGKFGFLESDYAEFLERQRRQNQPPRAIASPSEEATRQAANRLPQDLGETISAIQAKLQLLNWSTRDLARYMQQSGRWTCKNGATAGLLQGKSKDLSRCHDDEIQEILDAIAPLNPQEINHA